MAQGTSFGARPLTRRSTCWWLAVLVLVGVSPAAERAAWAQAAEAAADVAQPANAGERRSLREQGEQRIRAELAEPTVFEFLELPLEDVVSYVAGLHNLPVQLDRRALTDVGLGTDTPVTQNVESVSLASALDLMLGDLGLSYVVENEVLLITTQEEAESRLETRVYPVADLLGESGQDFDNLIEAIVVTTAPETWDEMGGPGAVAPFTSGQALVISQTSKVHQKIDQLLGELRRVQGPHVARAATRELGRTAEVESPFGDGDQVHTLKIYPLVHTGDANDAESLVILLQRLIEPGSWTGAALVEKTYGSLVVKQTDAVQRQVEKLLNDLGVLNHAGGYGGYGGLGGGGGGFGGGGGLGGGGQGGGFFNLPASTDD